MYEDIPAEQVHVAEISASQLDGDKLSAKIRQEQLLRFHTHEFNNTCAEI